MMRQTNRKIGMLALGWHAAVLLLINMASIWPEKAGMAAACHLWPIKLWSLVTGAGSYGFFAPNVSSPFRLVCDTVTVMEPTGIRQAAFLEVFQPLLPADNIETPPLLHAVRHAQAVAHRLAAAEMFLSGGCCKGNCHVQVLWLSPLGAPQQAVEWLTIYTF